MSRLENGFVYLWALFSVALSGVIMAGAAQVWQAKSQRDKETELLFIGEQFRKAIMSYHNTGTKQYPEKLEDLLQDSRAINVQRHIRKIYLDPITNSEDWGLIEETPANTQAGAATSQSNAASNQRPGTNPSSTTNPGAASGIAPAARFANPLGGCGATFGEERTRFDLVEGALDGDILTSLPHPRLSLPRARKPHCFGEGSVDFAILQRGKRTKIARVRLRGWPVGAANLDQ